MGPDTTQSSDAEYVKREDNMPQARRPGVDTSKGETLMDDVVEARLDDALEQVAHGATVSVPAILTQKGLIFAFTAILTNGFGAGAYGLYALSNRLQKFLVGILAGFKSGLNRFFPAASSAERDLLATFASLLLLSVSMVFGVGLFVAAPFITQLTDYGPQFLLFVRLFALGLPATIWLQTVVAVIRAFEEVGPYNLVLRVGVPTAHVIVAGLGTFVFHDLVLVIGGVIVTLGLIGVVGAGWLVRNRGLRPRVRGVAGSRIRSRYVQFTIPLFLNGFATTIQSLGYYPLIILFLSDVAGGVFAVGVLIGTFIQLPHIGINQFTPPVAAALHDENHHGALRRLYQVTSRLILIGVLAMAIPVIVYRTAVMHLFGPTFVQYASLLPGFVVGQVFASVCGCNGIFLRMTDHEREYLAINVALTAFLIVIAVPVTVTFDLTGLVALYLLKNVANNGLQVAVLYLFEDIHPFTRLYAKALVGAAPLVLVALAVRTVFPPIVAPVVGTVLGLGAYFLTIHTFGFTKIEGRLVTSLVERYRETVHGLGEYRIFAGFERTFNRAAPFTGVLMIAGGTVQAVVVSALPEHLFGLFIILGGLFLLVAGVLTE